MGRETCRAVASDPDLELVAAVSRMPGQVVEGVFVTEALSSLAEHRVEVAVDFTHSSVVMDDIRWCLANGIHAVVGTTGITPENLDELRALATGARSNVLVASNFAIGAVLMQQFAEEAILHFPAAEIIELHHDNKPEAPSGTALATARRMAAARNTRPASPDAETVPGARGGDVDGIRIHSVRLPGLVAHQEVIFGGRGQTLTIRHDSTDRSSFMPGVLAAVKAVASLDGLTVGLDELLRRT